MKAEIGFACEYGEKPDGRLRIEVVAQSGTECTMLQEFARRVGWSFDICSGKAWCSEPVVM